LYYCIVYSAIQPLKAASVLNKISSVQFRSIAVSINQPHPVTGTHMPYGTGLAQCYLPPGRGDIPALTLDEAGTRFSDPSKLQNMVRSRIAHLRNQRGKNSKRCQKFIWCIVKSGHSPNNILKYADFV